MSVTSPPPTPVEQCCNCKNLPPSNAGPGAEVLLARLGGRAESSVEEVPGRESQTCPLHIRGLRLHLSGGGSRWDRSGACWAAPRSQPTVICRGTDSGAAAVAPQVTDHAQEGHPTNMHSAATY